MPKWVGGLLLLLVAILLGAAREFLFINLNYVIDFVANHREVSYAHSAFRALVNGWSLSSLVLLKWLLALVFIAVMLGLSIAMARVLFGDHRYRKIILIGFIAIGALALVFHLAAAGSPAWEGVSVKLLHALQYPVVLLFIWAAALIGRDSPEGSISETDN